MRIKARPTLYKGVRMRSRLEAQFAAQLDELGHRWEYEPDCFANEHGQYLPDFRVDNWAEPLYVEVKAEGNHNVDETAQKMRVIWDSEPDAQLVIVEGASFHDGAAWHTHFGCATNVHPPEIGPEDPGFHDAIEKTVARAGHCDREWSSTPTGRRFLALQDTSMTQKINLFPAETEEPFTRTATGIEATVDDPRLAAWAATHPDDWNLLATTATGKAAMKLIEFGGDTGNEITDIYNGHCFTHTDADHRSMSLIR